MKYKIIIKSFLVLALIVAFGAQVDASEVTGNLSSSVAPTGSEVSGTIDNGTIAGTVTGGSSSGGGGTGGGSNNNGTVLGASTVTESNNPGQVLGAQIAPGFPNTGLGSQGNLGSIILLGTIVSIFLLSMYAYRTRKVHA